MIELRSIPVIIHNSRPTGNPPTSQFSMHHHPVYPYIHTILVICSNINPLIVKLQEYKLQQFEAQTID